MKTVSTTPQFAALDEDTIFKALDAYESLTTSEEDKSEPADPVVAEVARLIAAYADRFDYYCEAYEELPDEVLEYDPESVIEQIAYGIFTDAVFDAFQEADDE